MQQHSSAECISTAECMCPSVQPPALVCLELLTVPSVQPPALVCLELPTVPSVQPLALVCLELPTVPSVQPPVVVSPALGGWLSMACSWVGWGCPWSGWAALWQQTPATPAARSARRWVAVCGNQILNNAADSNNACCTICPSLGGSLWHTNFI